MRCLVDTSTVVDLAAFDLISEALTALGAAADDVAVVLHEAEGCAYRDPELQARLGREAIARLRSFLKGRRGVRADRSRPEYRHLTDDDWIDSGEAILFLAALEEPDATVVISDVVSLTALVRGRRYAAVVASLRGRVLCLEQVLLRIAEAMDFDALRARLLRHHDTKASLTRAFASGPGCSLDDMRAALLAEIESTRAATGGLLAPR